MNKTFINFQVPLAATTEPVFLMGLDETIEPGNYTGSFIFNIAIGASSVAPGMALVFNTYSGLDPTAIGFSTSDSNALAALSGAEFSTGGGIDGVELQPSTDQNPDQGCGVINFSVTVTTAGTFSVWGEFVGEPILDWTPQNTWKLDMTLILQSA